MSLIPLSHFSHFPSQVVVRVREIAAKCGGATGQPGEGRMDRKGFDFAVGLIRDWDGTRAQLQEALQIAGFFRDGDLWVRESQGNPGRLVIAFWGQGTAMETYSGLVDGMMDGLNRYLGGRKETSLPPGVQIHSGPDWRLWEHPERLVFARRGL